MKKKIALVTGASKGIGEAIAKKLAYDDIYVILVSRNKNLLRTLQEKIKDLGKDCEYHSVDIANADEVEIVMNMILKKHGRIDILVNCAGIPCFETIENTSTLDFNRCIDTNLKGLFYVTKHIVKTMKQMNSGQIINISSIAGVKGFKYGAGYVASKFGVEGFSQVLWEELRNYEVKVCIIRSGLVNSSFYKNIKLDEKDIKNLKYGLNVEDIADAVLYVANQSQTSNLSEINIRPIKKESQNLFFEILEKNYMEGERYL